MAYNTPETVADYLARFQMEITHRGKGTFTPDHVKYSLTIASGGKDFFTTFESNLISRLSMPRSRRNMAKTSPIVPTTSYRTTMISRGA